MKSVYNWKDLEPFGIIPLTGEACGLTYRILCDVTAEGQRIIEQALGIRRLDLPENWNSSTNDHPHVGSILLAPELLIPLGIFALLENGCSEVWLYTNGGLLGIEASDSPEKIERSRRISAEVLVRTFAYRGTAADRNVHQMSGRIT